MNLKCIQNSGEVVLDGGEFCTNFSIVYQKACEQKLTKKPTFVYMSFFSVYR